MMVTKLRIVLNFFELDIHIIIPEVLKIGLSYIIILVCACFRGVLRLCSPLSATPAPCAGREGVHPCLFFIIDICVSYAHVCQSLSVAQT